MNIKAILLDVDNTLLDFNECARVSLKEAMEQCGFVYQDSMYAVFERENNAIWKEMEKGLLTREELHEQRFRRILRALDMDENEGPAMEEVFQRCVGEGAEHVTGALELLRYLYEKYPLYVASNARQFRQVKRLEKAGMMPYIRAVFSSEMMGANKPAKAFFDGCFAAMEGISPGECVIIGDSLSADIEGGRTCGLKTIWYNHDKLPVPENCMADYVVHSLDEIRNIL
ncbi:MAG: YjjG family noncanonical pyrimidine nucleotidase [Clostridia bacterium]|nr:YjjG family noncanonical pyrimidine nucleotidase [Clostridia bacterium]